MHTHVTSQQMRETVEHSVAHHMSPADPSQPNTGLAPRVVSSDAQRLQMEFAFDVFPWMSNAAGVVHGGVLATIMDNAMGLTCHSLAGVNAPTISMTLNYARPVPPSATVHVRARIAVFGRTSAQVSAELFLPEEPDRVLVFGTGVYYTKAARPQS